MKDIRYGAIKVEELEGNIRLHIGNVYRDMSISFARRISSMLREAANRLEEKKNRNEGNG